MQPLPELIDSFKEGNVALSVYRYHNPIRNVYRIKAGVAYLDFNEHELEDLMSVLAEFNIHEEDHE